MARRGARSSSAWSRSPFVGARLDQVLVLEDPQHLARDRRADGVVRVREAVDEARRLGEDRVADRPGRRHEPEREVARRRALRADEDVRPNAPVVDAEPAARSARSRSSPRRRRAARRAAGRPRRSPASSHRAARRRRASRRRSARRRTPRRVPGPAASMARSSSAASSSASPSAFAPGSPARYGYAAETCRNRPSHASYGRRSGFRPDRSSAPERVAVIAPPPGDNDPALRLAAGEVVGARQLERRSPSPPSRRRPGRSPGRRAAGGGRARAAYRSSGSLVNAVPWAYATRAACSAMTPATRFAAVADADDDRAAGGVEVRAPVGVPDRRPSPRRRRAERAGWSGGRRGRATSPRWYPRNRLRRPGDREPRGRPVYEVRFNVEGRPHRRRRTDRARPHRRRRGVRGARAPLSGRGPQDRVPRMPGGRCRRCCPGSLPQGLRRPAPLPGRGAVPSVAPAHRHERGAQPASVGRPPAGSRATRRCRAGDRPGAGARARRRW